MKAQPKPFHHSKEEFQARYRAWVTLQPVNADFREHGARQLAWHAYCDARDGYEDGTSQATFGSNDYRHSLRAVEPAAQADLFAPAVSS